MSLTLDWLPRVRDILVIQLTWLKSAKWWGYTNYEYQTHVLKVIELGPILQICWSSWVVLKLSLQGWKLANSSFYTHFHKICWVNFVTSGHRGNTAYCNLDHINFIYYFQTRFALVLTASCSTLSSWSQAKKMQQTTMPVATTPLAKKLSTLCWIESENWWVIMIQKLVACSSYTYKLIHLLSQPSMSSVQHVKIRNCKVM